MPSPLIIHPDVTAIFAPQYFGSVSYYALLATYGRVIIDGSMRADKRFKSAHRCSIVDTRDRMLLTVPVEHPHGPHTWAQTRVSTHGQWWAKHLTALESAYGRTPFFEFYADRLTAIFDAAPYESAEGVSVMSLDCACDRFVRQILGLDNSIVYNTESTIFDGPTTDLRSFTGNPDMSLPYYQIRADKLGFHADLSILDLIFNLGPESPLLLKQMQK